MPIKAYVAARIRLLRRNRGWTQADLADRIGKSRPYVTQVETGRITPSLAVLDAIIMVFGRSWSGFFYTHEKHARCCDDRTTLV